MLYDYKETVDFRWVDTPHVASPRDVVSLIRDTSGCRWVAVEVGPDWLLTSSERYLRLALGGPEFEHVRSCPVAARGVSRIDLYRFIPAIEPAQAMDLVFPSFSARLFQGIEPIGSRR